MSQNAYAKPKLSAKHMNRLIISVAIFALIGLLTGHFIAQSFKDQYARDMDEYSRFELPEYQKKLAAYEASPEAREDEAEKRIYWNTSRPHTPVMPGLGKDMVPGSYAAGLGGGIAIGLLIGGIPLLAARKRKAAPPVA